MVEWYIEDQGKVLGPFRTQELKAFARTGRIRIHTKIRKGKTGNWVHAGTVKGLLSAAANSTKHSTRESEERQEPATVFGLSRAFLIGGFSLSAIVLIFVITFIIVNEISKHQAQVDAANEDVQTTIDLAEEWLTKENPTKGGNVEKALRESMTNELAENKATALATLKRVQTRLAQITADAILADAKNKATALATLKKNKAKALAALKKNKAKALAALKRVAADAMLADAMEALTQANTKKAVKILEQYVKTEHATKTVVARALLKEITMAKSKPQALAL